MAAKTLRGLQSELQTLYRATRAPKTAGRMQSTLGLAADLGKIRTLSQLTPVAVGRFSEELANSGRAPNTVATILSYLRSACSFAHRQGRIEANPFDAFSGFVRYVPTHGPAIHSAGSIGQVLRNLEAAARKDDRAARLYAWAAVLSYTGVRRDEALFLHPSDLDMERRLIIVRSSRERRLKRPTAQRVLPMPDELAAILAEWLPRRTCRGWVFPNRNGTPWTHGTAGYRPIDQLRRAGIEAGVEEFTPRSLRASYATLCATAWGIPPAILQKLMGHTDLRTTMKFYVHLEIEHLATAIQSVSFLR
jgi:integrase